MRGSAPTLRALAQDHTGGVIFVVHRLDKEASGVVLFAKDADAHRALNGAFERREVIKTYRAWVLGAVMHDRTVNQPLKEFGSGRMGVTRRGRPSITAYRVLETHPEASLLDVSPRTGKRHQIRVHLYSVGHPILGDPLYGSPLPVGGATRLMLHATALSVDTPETGPLTVSCEPPPDFRRHTVRAAP